jgi:phospholipase C
VIVIIGENRTFDHVFATYQPTGGQDIVNLLSKGIINTDGSHGTNFATAAQKSAVTSSSYEISPGSGQIPPDVGAGRARWL